MSAPLSAGAWEVLRALTLKIRIREFVDGWQAVGPWQEPTTSQLDSGVVRELLDHGFATREDLGIGRYLSITPLGERLLDKKTRDEIQAALQWVKDQ